MAEIINLRAVKKARSKTESRAQADANAAKFGRTKAERTLEQARADGREAPVRLTTAPAWWADPTWTPDGRTIIASTAPLRATLMAPPGALPPPGARPPPGAMPPPGARPPPGMAPPAALRPPWHLFRAWRNP